MASYWNVAIRALRNVDLVQRNISMVYVNLNARKDNIVVISVKKNAQSNALNAKKNARQIVLIILSVKRNVAILVIDA